jgi:hypothetical protein
MEVTYTTKEFMDFLIRYEARLEGGKARSDDSAVLEGRVYDPGAAGRARMS